MSEQDKAQSSSLQRPTSNKPEVWKAYWEAQGQPWRTEPEIDIERQKYLAERRAILLDIQKGVYPFKGIKLSRADVEWLLATHENGRGPVNWSDETQRDRKGLDLRSADLRQVDLCRLPLACMHGGLTWEEREEVTREQREIAAVLMEGANLAEARLEGVSLHRAHLEGANLRKAYMKGADLGAARLEGAGLHYAHLEGANLFRAHLEEAHLNAANLAGVDLRSAFFDNASTLRNVIISDAEHGFISVADVRWAGVNLALVKWPQKKREKVLILGDEYRARRPKTRERKAKDEVTRLAEYEAATRANRQLAVELQNQGLNELAAYFAYRAQLLQRRVLWHQQNFGRWLFSLLLAMLSGYGYRIWRIFVAYVLVVSLFAVAYFVLGLHYPPHLPLVQAFLESITALHGRVFLEQFNPNTPQIWLTALEAIMGLVIEGVFIAMLIQRFFGK